MKRNFVAMFYKILFCFFSLIALFGILGVVAMITIFDISGITFYLILSLAGVLLSRFFLRKKRAFDSKTSGSLTCDLQSPVEHATVKIPDCLTEKDTFSDIKLDLHSAPSKDEKHFSENAINRTVKTTTFPDIYIALDIETPNKQNDRISQIGLLLVKNGHIIENRSTLINPEVTFSIINQKITGIDSSMVINSPKFNEYWDSIKSLFENYVIIAHNAAFDLSVLCKTLDHYKLIIPPLNYICTYTESLNHFPQVEGHTLSSLADYFNIEVSNAHNAESDANVCYQIFEKMKGLKYQFVPTAYEITYDREKLQNHSYRDNISIVDVIDLPFTDNFNYIFKDKRFVLTGLFIRMPKNVITKYIVDNGGIVTGSVSGKTDFLIVGSKAEPSWKHVSYGTKIEKALTLLDGDSPKIQIVKESLITDYIESKL